MKPARILTLHRAIAVAAFVWLAILVMAGLYYTAHPVRALFTGAFMIGVLAWIGPPPGEPKPPEKG